MEIWRTVSLWMFLLSLLFTFLFLSIPAQYKWHLHGFLPPPEPNQVEVEFPNTLDPLNAFHTVLIGFGIYEFVHLRTLNGCLIVSFPFLLLYWFMQPRGSAPREGENAMARLHVTCPGPVNTRFT